MLTLDWSLQSAAIETALLVLGPGCRVALHQAGSWPPSGMVSIVGQPYGTCQRPNQLYCQTFFLLCNDKIDSQQWIWVMHYFMFFFHVPIAPEHRYLLRFAFQGQTFQFKRSILWPLSSTKDIHKMHAVDPITSDCKKHKDNAISGRFPCVCAHQEAGHPKYVHPLCTHCSIQFYGELGKSSLVSDYTIHHCEYRLIENASHFVI